MQKIIKTRYTIQEHYRKKHRRAHYDLRIINPQKSKAWSWAFPRLKFPQAKEKVLAIRTPDHKLSYIEFEGSLKSGDTVKVVEKGNCQILSWHSNSLIMKFDGKLLDGIYVFIKISDPKSKDDSWLVKKYSKKTYGS